MTNLLHLSTYIKVNRNNNYFLPEKNQNKLSLDRRKC